MFGLFRTSLGPFITLRVWVDMGGFHLPGSSGLGEHICPLLAKKDTKKTRTHFLSYCANAKIKD